VTSGAPPGRLRLLARDALTGSLHSAPRMGLQRRTAPRVLPSLPGQALKAARLLNQRFGLLPAKPAHFPVFGVSFSLKDEFRRTASVHGP